MEIRKLLDTDAKDFYDCLKIIDSETDDDVWTWRKNLEWGKNYKKFKRWKEFNFSSGRWR